jgi:hypothetical protein
VRLSAKSKCGASLLKFLSKKGKGRIIKPIVVLTSCRHYGKVRLSAKSKCGASLLKFLSKKVKGE